MMKLISLNTFGGRFFEPMMEFVEKSAASTDIFCFQEILNTARDITESNGYRANLYQELCHALPEFQPFLAVSQHNYDHSPQGQDGVDTGQATFVAMKHRVDSHGHFFIYRTIDTFQRGDHATLPMVCLYVQCMFKNTSLTICNLHGTSEPADKRDSVDRIAQSKKVLDFVQKQLGEKIITGDFNLYPDTKSITMFEDIGYRNLIKDFAISTTRGSLQKKLHPEYEHTADGWQEFADYTFVSAGISPTRFDVPDLAISDHLPLILEFDIT